MRSIWYSLAWKEWHEHKWKLAALTAVLCGTNLLFLGVHPREFFTGGYWITLLSMVPLAIFLGAYTAAGERSHSTASFLDALPVASWKPALNKLLAGVLTLAFVVAITLLLVYLLSTGLALNVPHSRIGANSDLEPFLAPLHVGNWFVNTGLTITAVAASLFLWTIAAGVNRADEVSAGAKAVLVIVIWWTLMGFIANHVDKDWFQGKGRPMVATVVDVSPGGAAIMFPKNQSSVEWSGTPLPAICGVAVHLGLATWFLLRFGRRGRVWSFGRNIEKTEAIPYWPRPPRRTQLGAIAWKQVRESGPLVLAGLAGIVGVSGLIICANAKQFLEKPEGMIEIYAGATAAFSYVLAIVLGIGVSHNDLSPQVNTFWRSRPISPDQWYWTKLATGISILFVSLYLPLLVLAAVNRWFGYDQVWNSMVYREGWIIAVAVCEIFFSAVTMMLILRHAVYAAILSVAVLYLGFCIVMGTLGVFRWLVWGQPLRHIFEVAPDDSAAIVGFVAVMALVIAIGWLATRYDWGRKSRY